MSPITISKWLWLLAMAGSAAAGATCYAPPAGDAINGVAQAPQFTSCNPDQAESMCCRTVTETGEPYDSCLSNGLCKKSVNSAASSYWRESCTDPTWKSPACLHLPCHQNENNNTEVTICPHAPEFYCCGSVNTSCCGTAAAFTIPSVNPHESSTAASSTPSSAATSQTSSPTSSQTSSQTSFSSPLHASGSSTAPSGTAPASSPGATLPSQSKSSNTGLSTAAKAGIGIGVSLVVLAAVGLLVFWLLRREPETGAVTKPLVPTSNAEAKSDAVELHSYSLPSEVPGYAETVYGELDERNYR